jgi:hypothetical protein
MKYLLVTAIITLFSSAYGATLELGVLNQKKINIGKLSQDQNQAVSDVIILERTAKTPKKVEVTYSFNYLVKTCVDYKIKTKFIKGFSKVVCEKSGGGTHNCREREFSGYEENERVCTNKGYELKTKEVTVTFNFKHAIPLNENSIETFVVSLNQKNMKKDSVKFELSSFESVGVYRLSKLGKNYLFKLK